MKSITRWLVPFAVSVFIATTAMAAVTISTVSKEVGKEGGAFSVNTGGSGSWTATSQVSWITLNRASGEAGVSCIYVVSANFSADARMGTLDISGNTFTVYQSGYEATLSPTSATADYTGGSGTIQVVVDAGVSWTAKANVNWLSVTPTSGTSVGTVTYKVSAYQNGVTSRTGTLTVAGKTFNVTQAGRDVGLSPTRKDLGSGVETFSVTVSALASTKWTVTPNASWISVVDSGHGYGNDTVIVAVGANPSVRTRTGTVSIGSQRLTVSQAGTTEYSLSITPTNATASPVGAYGNVAVYSTPDAPWMAESRASWITLSDGTNGYGNGNTKYIATANPTLASRTGTIAFWQLLGGSVGESTMQVIPTNMTARHFAFGDTIQGWVGNSTNATSNDFRPGTNDWTTFTRGHDGIWEKAIGSSGSGTIIVSNMNQLFPGSYTLNHGRELSTTNYGSYSRQWVSWRYNDGFSTVVNGAYSTNYYPYPATSSGPSNATYNFWIYVNQYPSSSCSIFSRSCVQGQDGIELGATNRSFALRLSNNGGVLLVQNEMTNAIPGLKFPTMKWTMLTVVGTAQKNIALYLDGEEVGSIPTSLSFGYFPPTDLRVLIREVEPHNSYYTYKTVNAGEVRETVQRLSVGGWDGAIDELTFIDHALTSAQVKVLYGTTKSVELYHTVTQGVIEPSVTPMSVSFEASGGSGNVNVTVAANTQWTAQSSVSWISLVGFTNHVGSTTVSFTVAPNPGTEKRLGQLMLAEKTVTVEQEGLWSQVTYDGTVFGETSGSGFISVQVEGDGTWTAKSDSAWLTLLDTSGHGSAEVMFVVDDFNTSVASRTATVTIAGKTVQITQRGYTLSIDPAVGEVGSNAGAGEIGVTAPLGAVWEAIVSADWITLVGGNMGVGSGTLRYTVADNTTGETRTGKIIISGQEYTVTQHPYLKLTTAVDGAGTVTGGGDYETNERVTLRASPDEGFAFTHWSGDAVGVESEVTIVMDMAKTVTAHFIPEDAAQRLAEEKAAQGGFYTREQMRALAMGDTVIEVEDGTVDLAIQLQECADLAGGDWGGVDAGEGEVGVDGEGKVHIRVTPKGNVAFYRLMGGGGESGE